MGTFMGHILPGSFFLIIGLRWTWTILHRYFLCTLQKSAKGTKKPDGIEFRNTCTTPCFIFGKEMPMESYCKIVAAAIGMVGEFYTAFDDHHHFAHYGNAQHMTMFFFFGLFGVIEILQYRKFPLPPDTDYMAGILALSMEGIIFYYHLHGRKHMDVLLHILFFYSVCLTIIATCFEMKYRNNVLAAYGRIYAILLQGTWICQIAFVLYPPYSGHDWDWDDHRQMMIITCMFTWHCGAIFIFLILASYFCHERVKRLIGNKSYYLLPISQSNYEGETYDAAARLSQSKKLIVHSEDEEI